MDDISVDNPTTLEKLLIKRPSRDSLIEKGILLPDAEQQKSPRLSEALKKRKGSLTQKGLERLRAFSFGKKRSPTKVDSPAASPETSRQRVQSFSPRPTSFEVTSSITLRERSGTTVERPHSPKKVPIIVRLDLKAPLTKSPELFDVRSRSFTLHPGLRSELLVTPRTLLCTPRTIAKLKPDLNLAVIKAQSIYRGKRVRRAYELLFKQHLKRSKIVNEIIATERSYVSTLKIIQSKFMLPLRDKSILSPEDFRLMFSEIETLLNLHTNFLAMLDMCMQSWNPSQLIGPYFIQMSSFLKVYASYVKAFDQVQHRLKELKSKSKFIDFCEDAVKDLEGEYRLLELGDFLVQPIQRVPRLKLLVNELKNHTWTDHRDYQNILLACEKLEQVVQFINEEKRHVENLSAILQIQNKLSGLDFHLLQPGRTLIKESVLTQLIDGKEKNRLFCLFNDILVIAKKERKQFFKSDSPKWNVTSCLEIKKCQVVSKPGKEVDNISVICQDNYFDVTFKTPDDKQIWMEELIRARDVLIEKEKFFEESNKAAPM